MIVVSELCVSFKTIIRASAATDNSFKSLSITFISALSFEDILKMKVSSRMGTEDDNQNSILKGILQNGSSFNYPGVCYIKLGISLKILQLFFSCSMSPNIKMTKKYCSPQ